MARRKKATNAAFQRGLRKAARSGVRDPGAVMASSFRKAYGQKALTRLAVAGRKRKKR